MAFVVFPSHLKHVLGWQEYILCFVVSWDFEIELKSNDLINLAMEFSSVHKLVWFLLAFFSQIYSEN